MEDEADAAARDLFERATAEFVADAGVTHGTGFGSSAGLRVHGKIFAMLMGAALVVKFPGERVTELVSTGVGAPFGTGSRSPMKEWVAVSIDHGAHWEELIRDAFKFVGTPT